MLKDILNTRIEFYQNIGPDYLHRWRLFPMIECRDRRFYPPWNLYLHHFLQSDRGHDLHDHPWPSWSLVLRGSMRETYWDFESWSLKARALRAGRRVCRPSWWRHRLELRPGESAWTLFAVGRKEREWGFWPHPGSFIHWRSYRGES
jgi:hypothetical protein